MLLLFFYDIASALFDLCPGSGINHFWRITHGERNENWFLHWGDLFSLVLLSRFLEDYNLFFSLPFSLRWAFFFFFVSAPWTAALLSHTVPAHLWIFSTLVWTDSAVRACARACACVFVCARMKSHSRERERYSQAMCACVTLFFHLTPWRDTERNPRSADVLIEILLWSLFSLFFFFPPLPPSPYLYMIWIISRPAGSTEAQPHSGASRSSSVAHCAFHMYHYSCNTQTALWIGKARRSCFDCIFFLSNEQVDPFPCSLGLYVEHLTQENTQGK